MTPDGGLTVDVPDADDWFGDPNVPHEPGIEPAGTSWRPACSCGLRAPLTHDTETGALRAAQNHATGSAPRPPGRYSAELDGDTVHIRCAMHPEEPLASFAAREYASGLGGRETELLDAVREHDRERHGEDRRA